MVDSQSKKRATGNMKSGSAREETLDPENWNGIRALGHRMLDDMMDHQKNIASLSFSFPTKESVSDICVPLTEEGEGEEKVYEVFQRSIRPYMLKNTDPRFWGAVVGTGSPYGMLAEMLAGGVNSNMEGLVSSGYVHKQVIDWIKEMLGYPAEAGGVLVSGGSEANFTGLAVARNAKAEVDMKAKGIQNVPHRMTLYVSDEGHNCLERSVELLGLGNESLRWVPTDEECCIKLDALRMAIRNDREKGNHPFCVIGCAGTVNSGAFDNLNVLADIAAKEKMWFHVDGAFGAWVKMSKTHSHLADGMERADSLAVDLHKWMYMPYGIGCTLVRDRLAHYSTFVYGHEAQYLKTGKDLAKEKSKMLNNPHSLALPLSRSFLSLKAYMLLRAYGRKKYSNLIQQNLDQINYLAELIRKEPDMEITAPVASNVVCFRYKLEGLDEAELERLNKIIAGDINKVSFWMVSDTTIKSRFMLRACNVNHRSRRSDFYYLVDLVKKLGEKHLPEVKATKA
jgi:glutamate/tyrosine decarboxylase-like PLP-dependent enzyme